VHPTSGEHSKAGVPDADGLLDLPAIRRQFRGTRFANFANNARRAACAWFVRLDLDPAKLCSLFHFPFPHAERACKITHGQSSGVSFQNALDAFKTFAAES
jgi:hypothetical protein